MNDTYEAEFDRVRDQVEDYTYDELQEIFSRLTLVSDFCGGLSTLETAKMDAVVEELNSRDTVDPVEAI